MDPSTLQQVKKLYLVHKVNAATETLAAICLHYKVPKTLVQYANHILDDHINNFKTLLIPCQSREQMIAIGKMNRPMSSAAQADFYKRTRIATKEQLVAAIEVLERKHIQNLQRLGEKKKYPKQESKRCDAEAEYYLDNNNYDFKQALAEYKADLKKEVDVAEQKRDERRMARGTKKRKGKKVGIQGEQNTQPPEVQHPNQEGCMADGCTIF